jgi:hypothetical protein
MIFQIEMLREHGEGLLKDLVDGYVTILTRRQKQGPGLLGEILENGLEFGNKHCSVATEMSRWV